MSTISFRSIGTIHTPFKEPRGMPIQPSRDGGTEATVEVLPELAKGLTDLEGFSHLILIYHFHRCHGYETMVTPYLDTREHGVFATRAPRRPNALGLSVVALRRVEGNVLHVEGVDIVDGTPLLDIKPFVPSFDAVQECRAGWLEDAADRVAEKTADERFHTD